LSQGTFHSYWNPPKAVQDNLLQINSRRLIREAVELIIKIEFATRKEKAVKQI